MPAPSTDSTIAWFSDLALADLDQGGRQERVAG
jgi:hypothetical protein